MTIMLINLKTRLPISYDSANNTLYAELKQTDLHQAISIHDTKPPAESGSLSSMVSCYAYDHYICELL